MASESIVYIVDDDEAARAALGFLITSVGLRSAPFASGEEFLSRIERDSNACAVLDLRLPGINGLDLLEKLNSNGRRLPGILLSAYADVPTAVRAIKIGAFDVLEKPCNDHALLECIHAALEHDRLLQRQLAVQAQIRERFSRLTPREREVLEHIIAGLQTRSIAAELDVAAKTIEAHRSHMMHKLEAESVVEVVRMHCILNAPLVTPGTRSRSG